jgi:hypothetical protein
MLRLFHLLWLAGPALLLGGCPMYPSGCDSDEDCAYDYVCDYPSRQCTPFNPSGPERCNSSNDCEPGLICDEYDRCVPPSESGGAAGSDNGGESGLANGGEGGARRPG